MYVPRHDQLVVHAVKLHVLKTPAFVDPARDDLLPYAGEIGGVEHPDLDPLWAEFGHKRYEERGT